ncbi:hypothetical protein UA08_06228 [Talaromyces atroroseus]|uniref:Uncharacterized protein n=1 Tax=Talaromyces atroroseus TaxID=1441469 RepID=A0A225AM93_TALAT|nr:hypothetical protein UA08_06228 [Talaromyces atroroseus]OKL58368.1 hypothetical protein UA08_06228 [Talaromyces atroroseus]
MEVERRAQEKLVTSIFSYGNAHKAIIQGNDVESFHLHVRLSNSEDQSFPNPELAEKTRADVKIGSTFDWKIQGMIVDVSNDADCVISIDKRSMDGFGFDLDSEIQVHIKIKPRMTSVANQIKAIKQAENPHLGFGDKPGNQGKGFSLAKTVLAHGCEVDPRHPDYFVLDVTTISSLELSIIQQRLDHLKNVFHLDEPQSSDGAFLQRFHIL